MALGVPSRLRPRILSTFGTTRVVGRQPKAPAAFTPGEIPVTHFQRLSRPQGTWFCRKEPRKKNPKWHHWGFFFVLNALFNSLYIYTTVICQRQWYFLVCALMCCACLTLCASSLPPGVSFLQWPGHVACLVRRCGIPLGRGWALPFNPGRLGIALSSWFDLSVGCFSTSPSACSRCSLPWIVPGCCWARSVSYALVSRMLLYSSGPAIDYMRGPIATHPQTFQPVASRYTDWAIPAPLSKT